MAEDMNELYVEEEQEEQHIESRESKKLTSAELYKIILKNPTYRVCESLGRKEVMRPLSFQGVDEEGHMVFEYDFAATMHAKHALCEDIIDLIGPGDELKDVPVYCDDWLIVDGENQTWYKKATVDRECYWILMHR